MTIVISDAMVFGYSYVPIVQLNGAVLSVSAAECRFGDHVEMMEPLSIDFRPDAGKRFVLSVSKKGSSPSNFFLAVADMEARQRMSPDPEGGNVITYSLASGTVSLDGQSVDVRVIRFMRVK